jgi:hypothetical protein
VNPYIYIIALINTYNSFICMSVHSRNPSIIYIRFIFAYCLVFIIIVRIRWGVKKRVKQSYGCGCARKVGGRRAFAG